MAHTKGPAIPVMVVNPADEGGSPAPVTISGPLPQPAAPIPTVEGAGALLTAIQALAATISGGRVGVAVASAVQTALDAINTATTLLGTTVSGGNLKTALQTAIPAGTAIIGKLLDALSSSGTVLQVSVGLTAVQFTATPTAVKSRPIVKADPGNTGIVYVGFANSVTTSNGIGLGPGDALPVDIDDISKLWTIATVASQKVAVVAGV